MPLFLTLFLAAAATSGPAAADNAVPLTAAARTAHPVETMLTAEWRRVRALDRRVHELLVDGARRSPTLAGLIEALHATDVIVYVEAAFDLPRQVAGRLLLQAAAGDDRYVRVQVRATLKPAQIIATIAHELQHALEVAQDRSVVNDAGLRALYERIGHTNASTHGYDTLAAIETGDIVRGELSGRRSEGLSTARARITQGTGAGHHGRVSAGG